MVRSHPLRLDELNQINTARCFSCGVLISAIDKLYRYRRAASPRTSPSIVRQRRIKGWPGQRGCRLWNARQVCMGVDPLFLVIPVSIATGQRTDHQYVFARERDTSALQQRRTVLWLETVASSDDYNVRTLFENTLKTRK